MSHHGGDLPDWAKEYKAHLPSEEEAKAMIARMQEQTGATGNFPHGKLGAGDEGEIAMAVGSDLQKGVVFIDFGKQVRWFGMEPVHLDGLIEMLQKHKARVLAAR